MINLSLLGSTGSIGVNTLHIVRTHPSKFRIRGLAARRNVKLLLAQAKEFRPEAVCLFESEGALELERLLRPLRIRVLTGEDGLDEISTLGSVDKVVAALVGAVGLKPLFKALYAKKDLAIANKEPLVMAGGLLMSEAERLGVKILPIDSEHSGLWQCLEGQPKEFIRKLILTSSGGPFHGTRHSLRSITPAQALKHPRWKMGAKITIDSATMMNKGLEVIEAANLFRMDSRRIEVLIHREAIIHALVEFVDGTHLANMGITDMRLPIQYALSYPNRLNNHLPTLNLTEIHSLHFEKPELHRFPCLGLGYEASQKGGTLPAVLNAANEIAVEAFLAGKIVFSSIPKIIEKTMHRHRVIAKPALLDFLISDLWARDQARTLL